MNLNIKDLEKVITIMKAISGEATSAVTEVAAAVTAAPSEDYSEIIGKHYIIRCKNAGVHAGVITAINGDLVTLKNSRRLWYWKAKRSISLSGVYEYGLDIPECKIGAPIETLILNKVDICELIETKEDNAKEIQDAPTYQRP